MARWLSFAVPCSPFPSPATKSSVGQVVSSFKELDRLLPSDRAFGRHLKDTEGIVVWVALPTDGTIRPVETIYRLRCGGFRCTLPYYSPVCYTQERALSLGTAPLQRRHQPRSGYALPELFPLRAEFIRAYSQFFLSQQPLLQSSPTK